MFAKCASFRKELISVSCDFAIDIYTAAETATLAVKLVAEAYLLAAVAAAAANIAMLPVFFAVATSITGKPGVAHAESTRWTNAELVEKEFF